MRFSLTIELGNDAMRTPRDIATSLRVVAVRLEDGFGEVVPWADVICDAFGNRVGEYEMEVES